MNSKQMHSSIVKQVSERPKKEAVLAVPIFVVVAVVIVVLCFGVLYGVLHYDDPVVAGVHQSPGFEPELFYRGLAQERDEDIVRGHAVRGVVVPHHYIASRMMADMFYRVSQQKPKTIILVGPNHYEAGDHPIIASQYGWGTPRGIVFPNNDILDDLVQRKTVFIDEDVMAREHSVGGLMPFVKQFAPSATVVPIIVKQGLTLEEIVRLSTALTAYAREAGVLIIASVDFSHFLSTQEANQKDQVTLELMRTRNYDKILTLNNDYMDSPPSLITLFTIMDTIGANTFKIIKHNNSGLLTQNKHSETTSYFTITFH